MKLTQLRITGTTQSHEVEGGLETLPYRDAYVKLITLPLQGIPVILKNSIFLLELTKFTYNCP